MLFVQLVGTAGLLASFADGKPVRLSVGNFETDAVTPFELLDILLNRHPAWLSEPELKLVRFSHR